EDLCALGARFVEGELPLFPGWGSPTLDDESDAIARDLAALNRAGFLTVASQPGREGEDPQRAFVCGVAEPGLARRIARAARGGAASGGGLECAVFGPGESGGTKVPVSLHAGEARVFAGHADFEAELECFREHLGREGLEALSRASWISVFDPAFGRKDLLWIVLRNA